MKYIKFLALFGNYKKITIDFDKSRFSHFIPVSGHLFRRYKTTVKIKKSQLDQNVVSEKCQYDILWSDSCLKKYLHKKINIIVKPRDPLMITPPKSKSYPFTTTMLLYETVWELLDKSNS